MICRRGTTQWLRKSEGRARRVGRRAKCDGQVCSARTNKIILESFSESTATITTDSGEPCKAAIHYETLGWVLRCTNANTSTGPRSDQTGLTAYWKVASRLACAGVGTRPDRRHCEVR